MDINTLNNLALAPVADEVTTGATLTELNPAARIIYLTTGGTAGDELANLDDLPSTVTIEGSPYAPEHIGQTLVVVLKVQTDGSDVVKITRNGGDVFAFGGGVFGQNRYFAEVVLDWPGATAVFVFTMDGWRVANDFAPDYQSGAAAEGVATVTTEASITFSTAPMTGINPAGVISLSPGDSTGGAAGHIILQAGDGTDAAAGYVSITGGQGSGAIRNGGAIGITGGNSVDNLGGNVTLQGGPAGVDAIAPGQAIVRGGNSDIVGGVGGLAMIAGGNNSSNSGDGGDVRLSPGGNGDGSSWGRIIMEQLPTANPAYAGQVWNDSGVLKISAG
jgi:hypothetical protein